MEDIFGKLSNWMDEVEQYDGGWDIDSVEKAEAELDVFLYPYPAESLPPRPKSPDYKILIGAPGRDISSTLLGPWRRSAETQLRRILPIGPWKGPLELN